MRNTTIEHSSAVGDGYLESHDGDDGVDVAEATPRRRRPGKKSAAALMTLAIGASLFILLGGDDHKQTPPTADGSTELTDVEPGEPLPPRPILPSECLLADAGLVVDVIDVVNIAGGGGVDNTFVAEASGAFERVVSARVLDGEVTGALGLWGVTTDGAVVALNDVATGITTTDNATLDPAVISDVRGSAAAELVSNCTKLSAGG
jgi:hypothetical protein